MDQVNAGKTYTNWRWVVGFVFIVMNVVCHSLIVPFCDLTLLSCNAATAIIVNMLLSIHVLGEKFIWQYDLVAMFLIATGSVTIVINAHTEQVEFNAVVGEIEDRQQLLVAGVDVNAQMINPRSRKKYSYFPR